MAHNLEPSVKLAHAVKAGRNDIARVLLADKQLELDVDKPDEKGRRMRCFYCSIHFISREIGVTLLMHCAFKRCTEKHEFCSIAELLVKRGANVNAVVASGHSALMIAAYMVGLQIRLRSCTFVAFIFT